MLLVDHFIKQALLFTECYLLTDDYILRRCGAMWTDRTLRNSYRKICLHFQVFLHYDRGNNFLRNAGKFVKHCALSHSRTVIVTFSEMES